MKKISRIKRPASAESIAQLAEKGGDVSPYFTNKGKMIAPHESVGVELNENSLKN